MRRVTSERAERAKKELMFTYAAHLHWGRRPLARRGRVRASRQWLRSPSYLTLPHFAAVCEEFSRGVLIECSEPHVPATHPLLEQLWLAAESKAETWPGQEAAWKEWHRFDFAKAGEYKALRPLIEARNAIVHGLGDLTRRQTRKDGGAGVRKQLASAGIRTSGRRLLVDDTAVKNCLDIAAGFVIWLDVETETRGLRPTTS
jgi:hypothetical protein